MMGFFRSLAGKVKLELTSADKETALRLIGETGIEMSNVVSCGELTVSFTTSQRSLRAIERIAKQRGERLIILGRSGIFWPIWSLRRRPVLLAGMLILLVLTCAIPGRVLFLTVEGNEMLPARQILEAAQEAGIRFGASRRSVRSEKMKNELLAALPQLQWAGINTYGCTAVITVRERALDTKQEKLPTVSNLVASCDGVITSLTAAGGSALCVVGQAVEKGQVLISGYVDNGLVITATRAQGEIFAQTQHEMTAMMPPKHLRRVDDAVSESFFSLILGKKRINFVKGSGISDATCVKMYSEYYLTLPGGYCLPIALVKETLVYSNVQADIYPELAARQLLSQCMKAQLQQQGIALTILDAQETFQTEGNLYRMTAWYSCTEMIGREQREEIGEFHGKTN